jgi:hypothetical protein
MFTMFIYCAQFVKSLLLFGSRLINVPDDGLCGMTAAAESLELLGVSVSAPKLFEMYHKKKPSTVISRDDWADDSFFEWLAVEYNVEVRLYRDAKDEPSALELYATTGSGVLNVDDRHISIYVAGSWNALGIWLSLVHYNAIDTSNGRLDWACAFSSFTSAKKINKEAIVVECAIHHSDSFRLFESPFLGERHSPPPPIHAPRLSPAAASTKLEIKTYLMKVPQALEGAAVSGLLLTSDFVLEATLRGAEGHLRLEQATPPARGINVRFDAKNDADAKIVIHLLEHQFFAVAPVAASMLASMMKWLTGAAETKQVPTIDPRTPRPAASRTVAAGWTVRPRLLFSFAHRFD